MTIILFIVVACVLLLPWECYGKPFFRCVCLKKEDIYIIINIVPADSAEFCLLFICSGQLYFSSMSISHQVDYRREMFFLFKAFYQVNFLTAVLS